MKRLVVIIAALAALSACSVDPEKAAVRRAALIQKVFPNPSDQQGLDLVLPLTSSGVVTHLAIGYFTKDVSQPEVTRRVASFCARQNSSRLTGQARIDKDMGLSARTFSDGSKKQIHTVWYDCVRAK
ncbi:hypothetical protein [Profundibacter sp.]|uniref:hypothetical protein n=1 Tax=Profundibacter sp. TaxID=3101071 RepID=UPI003D0E68AF